MTKTQDIILESLIEMHASYHSGKQGLNDKDFKDYLIRLIDDIVYESQFEDGEFRNYPLPKAPIKETK